jgi:hypothetical protein
MPQYSLDNVKIDGFRGLRKLSLDGLGLVTILVGENNSGKTSVLEAMSILCSPLEPLEWGLLVRRRDFGGLDETRIQSLRWCFHQSGLLADPDATFVGSCEMECEGTFPLRRLRVTYADIIGEPQDSTLRRRPGRRKQALAEIDVPQPRRGAEIAHFPQFVDQDLFGGEEVRVQFWEDELFIPRPIRPRARLVTETLTPYSYQVNRFQIRRYSEALLSHRGMALELVQEFDPEITSIEVASLRGARPAIYLVHKRLGPAPLSVFGDALRRVVLLATTIAGLRKGLLFVDEIETGLHASALAQVFTWLTIQANRFCVQIVATTHSLEAVDALLAGIQGPPESLVAFHLDQTPEMTRARRFDADLLTRLRKERGLDVR